MKAIAYFNPKINNGIEGFVKFSQKTPSSKVKVNINLKGFQDNDPHAIHIHEFGDISNGCHSAGPHYNPTNETHGTRYIKGMPRHAGDLINNIYPKRHVVKFKYDDEMLTLYGSESIIGRTVVIHQGEDDCGLGGLNQFGEIINLTEHTESLKTGNAGGRMACSIIGLAK